MPYYYVNKKAQANGDHEVHQSDCPYLPDEANRIDLGNFVDCVGAVKEAKKHYLRSNGCYYCSNKCHTT